MIATRRPRRGGRSRPERLRLQLYIDPESCICAACAPECPVEAIFEEEKLPAMWAAYRASNARFFAGPRPTT